MAKVLVTGANGFIGSHLVDSLLVEGHEVVCLCRNSNKPLINLLHLLDNPNVKIVLGDYTDPTITEPLLDASQFVFHMVSFGSPADQSEIEKNMEATFQFINLCSKCNVEKFIYPSSGGTIYGNQDIERLNEDSPKEPISLYGNAKLRVEKYLEKMQSMGKLNSLVFRISNPFGVRQNPLAKQGFIAVTLNNILNQQPINVFGDGSSIRDFIYVEDVTKLITRIFLLDTLQRVYNLGSGSGLSINDILHIYRQNLGLSFETNYEPARGVDVRRVVLDVTRIKDEFDFELEVDFTEGVKATYEYIRKLYEEGAEVRFK